eukprot:9991304-Lingulodinium_polyedra.AAC.1
MRSGHGTVSVPELPSSMELVHTAAYCTADPGTDIGALPGLPSTPFAPPFDAPHGTAPPIGHGADT